MIHKLKVKATEQEQGLYIAYHLADADTRQGEFRILASGRSIIMQEVGGNREIVVSLEDLMQAIMEVA